MQLRPGIRVLPSALLDGALELSSGSTLVGTVDHGNVHYDSDAIGPAKPWRAPTDGEWEQLVGWPVSNDPGFWIALIQAPEELLLPYEAARSAIENLADADDILRAWNANTPTNALSEFRRFVTREFGSDSSEQADNQFTGGIRFNRPALSTVAVHPTTNRFVGLHVDDFHPEQWESRHLAPNRIAINLGTQDRFFLFVNLPMLDIAQIVGYNRNGTAYRPGCTLIGRKFLSENPDYPVIKLRLRPGEGYLAPTENMLHDGTTVGMTRLDVSVSLHGSVALLPRGLPERQADYRLTREE
jgi:hypothetical protein